MPHATTRIDLLRHGLPDGPKCMRGHVDPELTEQGWEQMRFAISNRLPVAEYQQVISSDLLRCAEFAAWFSQTRSLPLQKTEDFRELNFGDWDGVDFDTMWKQHGEALANYWSDPWGNHPPNGETMHSFGERIETAWHQLIEQHKGNSVLLVTHAGVIRHLMAHLLKMPLPGTAHISALDIPYAALVSVEVWHDPDGRSWPKVCWPRNYSE